MTCTTWDCFRLEVRLIREAREKGWRSGQVTYTGAAYREVLAWGLDPDAGRPCLLYRWGVWERGEQPAYRALYVETPAAIGGTRTFWQCDCGRRVTVLYLPRGNLHWPGHHPVFACRHCYHLPYGSQHESASDRMWRRYHARMAEATDPTTPLRRRQALYRALDADSVPAIEAENARFLARAERVLAETPTVRRSPGRPRKHAAESNLAPPPPPVARPPGRPRVKRPYSRKPRTLSPPPQGCASAFCPRCRDRRELVDGHAVTFSNGRPALRGRCGTCGCRMARIVERAEAGVDRPT